MEIDIWSDADRQKTIDKLMEIIPEKGYVFSLKLKRKNRSVAQNCLYWMNLLYISEETGISRYDLHEYFKNKYLRCGIFFVFGVKLTKCRSTRDLNVAEFSEYLDSIKNDCLDRGIVLPDAKDKGWDAFLDLYDVGG